MRSQTPPPFGEGVGGAGQLMEVRSPCRTKDRIGDTTADAGVSPAVITGDEGVSPAVSLTQTVQVCKAIRVRSQTPPPFGEGVRGRDSYKEMQSPFRTT